MSWWQPSHLVGAAPKFTFVSFMSRFGGLWQSMQAVARWAPWRGNEVEEWSNRDNSFQALVEWQASQPAAVPSAFFCCMRSLNCPRCGSTWQLVLGFLFVQLRVVRGA